MTKTFMRVDKELLLRLKSKKIVERESYADVIKRMIDSQTEIKKEDLGRSLALKRNVKRRKGGFTTARDIELMMGY
jgi:predicted nucleic-acid-binding protein